MALWRCDACDMFLCDACDVVLHMRRSMRSHVRRPVERNVAESRAEHADELHGLKIDGPDGAVRLRLPWLMVMLDINDGKAIVELKQSKQQAATAALAPRSGAVGMAVDATGLKDPYQCRFCTSDLEGNVAVEFAAMPAFANVCINAACGTRVEESCTKMLPCGHDVLCITICWWSLKIYCCLEWPGAVLMPSLGRWML